MDELKRDDVKFNEEETGEKALEKPRKLEFVWQHVTIIASIHIMAVYGLYLSFTKALWSTIMFAYFLSAISNVGTTAGAHRLWSHKSYKVNLPLKLLILMIYSITFQTSVFKWARDHRMHHKYCDTDADPHNSNRGFFFSHIGWLMLKKHPEVVKKQFTVDMSDITSDPVLEIHRRYYNWWLFIFGIMIPTYIPTLWGESITISFFVAVGLRQAYSLHVIFLINSAAHMWGFRPYDKEIRPAENKTVSFLASGEGFHNYHHTFPWDYRAAELGGYFFNTSRMFIDMMAKIGWAYDLKTVSDEMIEKRSIRTGDGSHPVWGLDGKDIPEEYRQSSKILH